ncbi:MAG: TSUP family transporter [Alphaproteobacteria bacterium]|nr:TSUP family transporter [Alphaproteobacteria bacterium]
MSGLMLLLLAGFSVFVGGLIGAAGIGGVLLVPFLAYVMGIDIHLAITAAMFGFIFAGLMGAVLYARYGSIRWAMAGWLIAGAMPAAFLGAFTASASAAGVLEAAIALLLLFAGSNALRPSIQRNTAERVLGPAALIAIGAVTGYGSAMTGTGGPLILVPLLVWLRFPVLTAVGLSQATQFPLASLATIGNFVFGEVDIAIGAAVAVGLALGVAVGAKIAHSVRANRMKRVVAWVTIGVGVFIAARLVIAFLLP